MNPGAEMTDNTISDEVEFLCERLRDFEAALYGDPNIDGAIREWLGHVSPALTRLNDALRARSRNDGVRDDLRKEVLSTAAIFQVIARGDRTMNPAIAGSVVALFDRILTALEPTPYEPTGQEVEAAVAAAVKANSSTAISMQAMRAALIAASNARGGV